jgi:hypothetical protein
VQLGHEFVAPEEMASELLIAQAEGPELATRIMKMVLQILTQLSHYEILERVECLVGKVLHEKT